jgi:hypothetical protein
LVFSSVAIGLLIANRSDSIALTLIAIAAKRLYVVGVEREFRIAGHRAPRAMHGDVRRSAHGSQFNQRPLLAQR